METVPFLYFALGSLERSYKENCMRLADRSFLSFLYAVHNALQRYLQRSETEKEHSSLLLWCWAEVFARAPADRTSHSAQDNSCQ